MKTDAGKMLPLDVASKQQQQGWSGRWRADMERAWLEVFARHSAPQAQANASPDMPELQDAPPPSRDGTPRGHFELDQQSDSTSAAAARAHAAARGPTPAADRPAPMHAAANSPERDFRTAPSSLSRGALGPAYFAQQA